MERPVSFVFYPKHEYRCPNLMRCPHVGGAALGSVVFQANENDEKRSWLWRQLDAARAESDAKGRRIRELEERVAQLERELKAERQKQFKANKQDEELPVETSQPQAEAKKRGAPVGHPGWFRPTPTKIDRTIDVSAPPRCPHCGAAVKPRPDLDRYEHVQEDLIGGLPTVTCYRHEEGRCTNPKCRLWVRQAGDGEILGAMIGPQMRARGMFLRFDIGMTHRKAVAAIEGLDSLSFTPAALLGFEKKAAEKARPLAQDVAKKLRACEVNHADETYYTINGKRALAWFHGNERLAHFYICGTRSGKISRKILGEDYAGGLVMDCYTGYDRHATKIKQRCLQHLKHSAMEWRKVTSEKAAASRQFFDDVTTWTRRGCRWYRRRKQDSPAEQQREATWLRSEQARLESVVLDSKKARTLQRRIRRYSKEWLTFLDHPGVPPTNNLAEQAVRFLVILRKLTFGSRTRAGARRTGTMLTVIQTAKRQGNNAIQFLVALFTLPPNEAVRAMYARC
jgi:transposase